MPLLSIVTVVVMVPIPMPVVSVIVPIKLTVVSVIMVTVSIKPFVKIPISLKASQWVFREQCASVTFRCGTVLPYLIHKEDLRHIVYYQDFGPVGHRFGFRSTEVYIHDKDSQRCRGSYHGHCCNVVFSYRKDKQGINNKVAVNAYDKG